MLQSALRRVVFGASLLGSLSVATPGISQDVTKSGTTVTIKGATSRDVFTITGGAAGTVVVTNNLRSQTSTFTGIRNVDVDLRGGNDSLTVSNLNLSGYMLTAKMGADDDYVSLNGTIVADVKIDGELGYDDIESNAAVIDGDLTIDGGIRDDLIDVSGSTVNGRLWIDAQGGADDVYYEGVIVYGQTHIDLGADDDYALGTGSGFYDDVEIIAGLGDDLVDHAANSFYEDLFVDLRGGDVSYFENNSFVGGDYTVDGGAGTDHFDHSGTAVNGSLSTKSIE